MIEPDDKIVIAWPERASGPGWANWPIWVIVRRQGQLVEECIQPTEFNDELSCLYDVCAVAAKAITQAMGRWRRIS